MDSSETVEKGCPPNHGSSQHSHSNITLQQQSQPQHQHFHRQEQPQYFSEHEHCTHHELHHGEDVTSSVPSEALLSSATSLSNSDAMTPPVSSLEEREKDEPGGTRGKKHELTPTPDSTTISTMTTSPLTSSTGDNVSPPPVSSGGMAPAEPLEVHEHQDHHHHQPHGETSADLRHQIIIASTTVPPIPAGPVESHHISRTHLAASREERDNIKLKTDAADHQSSLPSLTASAPTQLSSTATTSSQAAPSSSSMAPTSSTPAIAIKILVSNNASGSIIGRSGQTISDLQTQSSSRIKLSQSGDCFPGTTDRVCLIQGGLDNVKAAVSLILKKLHDLQAAHHQQQAQYQSVYTEIRSTQQDQGEEVLSQAAVPPAAAQNHFSIPVKTASELKGVGPESSALPTGATSTLDQVEVVTNTSSKGTSPDTPPLPFSVRILVPTPCCGMLIGRGGSNIKSMAELSGVSSIRLSPKEATEVGVVVGGSMNPMTPPGPPSAAAAAVSATSERIVTVSGPDLNRCITCIELILDGMAVHPEMCRYVNMTTSYTRAVSAAHAAVAAAAAAQSGSSLVSPTPASIPPQPSISAGTSAPPHYHQQQPHLSPSQSQQQQHHGRIMSQASHLSLVPPPSMQSSSSASSMPQQPPVQTPIPSSQRLPITQPLQESPKMVIGRQQGATSGATSSSAVGPMCPPFAHGHASSSQHPLSPPHQSMYILTAPPASRPPIVPAAAYTQQQPQVAEPSWRGSSTTSQHASDSSLAGETSSSTLVSSSMEQLSAQLQGTSPFGDTDRKSRRSSATDHTQSSQQTSASQGQQQASIQIAVPDNLIGAILGRGGQTLTELQLCSQTRIQISQRGVFVPGTNHRIVTITGPSVENVATAQFLINQRMARNANRPMSASVSGTVSQRRMGATISQDSTDRGDRMQPQQQPPAQTLSCHAQQSYFSQQSSSTTHHNISSSPDSQQQSHRSHTASSARPQRRHQSHHDQRSKSGNDDVSPSTSEGGSASDAINRGRRGSRHSVSQRK